MCRGISGGCLISEPDSIVPAYDDFEQAFNASIRIFEKHPVIWIFSAFKRIFKPFRQEIELDRYSNELLKYIGAINWNREKHLYKNLDTDHPFSAVFDSLKILKTDLDENQKERRKIERIYKKLFNHVADPTIVFDQKTHRIYDCNNAFINIYGYTRDELKTMTPDRLHPKAEKSRVQSNIDNKSRPGNWSWIIFRLIFASCLKICLPALPLLLKKNGIELILFLPEDRKGIEKAYDEFENDKRFFFEILNNFIQTVETQVPKINQGIKDADFSMIKNQAHSIKGSAGILTAEAPFFAAKALEASALEKDLNMVQVKAQDLSAAFSDLKAYTKSVTSIF